MKRHLSDLTNDSNDAKASIPSEIDIICGITEQSHAPPTEVMNEYRNDDLDITFVDNEFEDLGSDKNKEYPPFDIKYADTTEVQIIPKT